jgi:hypothetical protein
LFGTGGNISGSSGITVAAGATIGTVTTNAGSLTNPINTLPLTLNLGSSVGGGSNLQLNLFSSTSDTLNAGALTLNTGTGTVLVTLNDTTSGGLSGQYTLMSWTSNSGVTAATADFTLAGSAQGEGSLLVSGDDLFFDATTQVPEPGEWAMMLGGFALLVAVQRRRLQSL